MKSNLMCHVVAGYPSANGCVELLLGMQKIGVGIIEVQIPFSDPIADGETIMQANDKALKNGMDVKSSFAIISRARAKGLDKTIYVMSYTQKLIHFGIDNFCEQAKRAGVNGLIIPDLPYDSKEYELLVKSAKYNSLHIVPVISPGMNKARLAGALSGKSPLIYLTSIKGITGNKLKVTRNLKSSAEQIRQLSPNSEIAIGFGLQNSKDVSQILRYADKAVVGSAAIRKIEKSGINEALNFIEKLSN